MPSTLLDDILKALSPNQVEGLKLKRCVDCGFFKEGYCTQSSPATKPLTPYDAQLCPYYSPPAVIASIKEEAQPVGYTKIDKVSVVDLLPHVQTVDEVKVTNVVDVVNVVDQLKKIRDIVYPSKSLIVNPSFEQDDLGWSIGYNAVISTVNPHWGLKCLSLPQYTSYASQPFPIPIGTSWITQWALWMSAPNVSAILRVQCVFTDGTTDTFNLSPTIVDQYQRKTFAPTANKYIEQIILWNYSSPLYVVQVDDLETVF